MATIEGVALVHSARPSELDRGRHRDEPTLVGLDQLPPTFVKHPVMAPAEHDLVVELAAAEPMRCGASRTSVQLTLALSSNSLSRLTEQAWKANHAELLAMARRLQVASDTLHATVKSRDISADAWQKWELASKEWHEARNAMFGEEFDKSPDPHLAAIRSGDPGAVETAIRFLEADPNCFHAGYAKERFLRALKVVPLSGDQAHRLRLVMIHALADGYRHELGEWCRLAPSLDINEVRADLRQMADRGGEVRERALWSLDRIDEYLQTRQAIARSKG